MTETGVDERVAEAPAEPKESPIRALVRSAAHYSIGTIVAMLGSIARVGVTARVLTDTENGVWLGLQLLMNYGGNLHLGTLYGLFRSVPMLRAAGDDAAAEREKETAFTFVVGMTVVGAMGLFVLAPRLTQASSLRHVLLTMALLAANLLRMYWSMILRAESRFKELSAAWGFGFGVTVLTIPLILRYKLDGVLVSMLAQTIVETIYLAKRAGTPRMKIHRPVLRSQLRVGLMTLAITVFTLALTTADRTMMLRFCGAEATGLYYLGANIITLVPALAAMPTGVLTPKFFERVGRGEDLRPIVERPLDVLAAMVALVCGGGAALLPVVVHRVWPNHVPGIPAALAATFATAPAMLVGLPNNIYYALDRQGRHVVILAVSAVAAYAFAAFGIRLGGGAILGAVIGAGVAATLYYFVTLAVAMRLVPGGAARVGLALAIRAATPTVVVMGLLAVVAVAMPGWLAGGLGGAAVAAVVVTLGTVPFVPRAIRAFRGR